jgi:hypothetical protein
MLGMRSVPPGLVLERIGLIGKACRLRRYPLDPIFQALTSIRFWFRWVRLMPQSNALQRLSTPLY